ncbi:hypothetical protein GGD50_000907 [Rhizobium paranaense]|uniref:Transmembrane protein n=1 Tax=Rhizobium paranaense TaxID=1650438 RepID=A0A7W9D013_9HYPH|nr:hypothetical protein [Rhizobium paranaense]
MVEGAWRSPNPRSCEYWLRSQANRSADPRRRWDMYWWELFGQMQLRMVVLRVKPRKVPAPDGPKSGCISILHRHQGLRMNSLSLPWIVGPVPIMLTAWSAIVFGRTVSSRRALKIGSGNIASSFVLSLGLSSIIFQRLYPEGGFIVFILSQLFSSVFCCIITNTVNYFSNNDADFPRKDLSWMTSIKVILVGAITFFLFNIVYFLLSGNKCNGQRCYAFEYLFGRNDKIFSSLYIGYFAPTVFLTISIFVFWEAVKKFHLYLRAR